MTERTRYPVRLMSVGVYYGSGSAKTIGPPKKVRSGARPAKDATNGSSSSSKPRD